MKTSGTNVPALTVIREGIRIVDGTLCFGDFTAREKVKAKTDLSGTEYAVKTYSDATRLEKNGRLLIESVPGASFMGFMEEGGGVSFTAFGEEDAQITMELEETTEYALFINGESVGNVKSNIAGKVNFSVSFEEGGCKARLEKIV